MNSLSLANIYGRTPDPQLKSYLLEAINANSKQDLFVPPYAVRQTALAGIKKCEAKLMEEASYWLTSSTGFGLKYARAQQLADGARVSLKTLHKMYLFFKGNPTKADARFYGGEAGRLWVESIIKPQTLYVARRIKNKDEIVKWFKDQGCNINADDLHITICFSTDLVVWSQFKPKATPITIKGTKERHLEKLGTALVQRLYSKRLDKAHQRFRDGGASWDFDKYLQHFTIMTDAADYKFKKLKPYTGPIELGPEYFEVIKQEVKASVEHDGDKYFNINLRNYSSKMSRETLVHISPTEHGGILKSNLDNIKAVAEAGIKFESIPFLMFQIDKDNKAICVGHEGRNRATYLKLIGVKSIPVSILSREGGGRKAIRWGACDDPNSYDYIEEFPKFLYGDNNSNKIPFPVSDIYPRHNKVQAKEEFQETKHPRLADGEFAPKNSGSTKAGHRKATDHDENTKSRNDAEHGGELPEHVTALKIPPAWKDVTYATNPDAHLLATGKDAKGRPQAIYSLKHSQIQAEAKFARINELNDKYDSIEKQNHKSRKSDNKSTREAADCLYLIMKMGIRPGSDSDTGAKVKAYGASNLLGKHIVIDGKNVRLQFTGKKGVELNLPVHDKDVAKMLIERKKEAGDDGRVFGNLNEGKLLNHTHSMDGGGFKTKDFRTRIGTVSAINEIKNTEAPKNEKEYKKAVLSVAKKVADKLGNTPTIALQSYINPSVFAKWQAGVQPYGK